MNDMVEIYLFSFCSYRIVYFTCKSYFFSADPKKIPLLGDALVIAGTVGFAFSNVGEVSHASHASAAISNGFSQWQ